MSKEFSTGMRREVLFCHGLESGPQGSKYRALCDAGYQVIAPDCRGKSLRERVDIVVPLMRELRPYVVGSSYGGITAVLAGMRAGVELPGIVLCAPALERDEEPNTDPTTLALVGPTIIIHGVQDDVIPIDVSRRYAARTGAKLIEVHDGHRLENSRAAIVEAFASLGAEPSTASHLATSLSR
jgi:pimeloyl-ACP methyl ester carboxylesterase